MKAGPKAEVTARPLTGRGLPQDGPERVIGWCERYLRVPRGVGAKRPLRLRGWQRDIIGGAYAPGVRSALVSMPRGNGKSALAAALAVRELYDGPEGAQALIVASDQRQAGVVFGLARRMIELDDRLAARVQVFRDRIIEPFRDAVLAPLPAEPDALHGWDPSLLVVDELHVVTEAVWEAVSSASGKRPESLTLAISTPPEHRDVGVMWRLVEHGRAGDDPAFYLREYTAPTGCNPDDRGAWALANPALGDFLALDAMAAVRRTLRESTFRRLRLGQWVDDESSWIDWDTWAERADPDRIVGDGEPVVLGFDGSASGDSTALVGCTLDGHVFVLGIWENPGDPRWRVPRGVVDQAVDAAFARYDVRELACDPWGWRSEIEAWAARYGETRVIEWATNVRSRMGPATDRLYQAVQARTLSHDGDERLAAHVAACVAEASPVGDLVRKERRWSPRKIDAAVAAIVAVDRAAFHAQQTPKRRRVVAFR